jgi:hypothetical protein
MQLTSLMIGGVEYIDSALLDQTEITHAVGGEGQTGAFSLWFDDYGGNAVVGSAEVGCASIGHGIVVADEVIAIGAGVRQFAGRIAQIEPDWGEPEGTIRISCQDYTSLLDTVVIESESYDDASDAAILADLFATYLPEVTVSATVVVASLSIAFEDMTLRECVEAIRERTAADWWLDFYQVLQYGPEGSTSAPFGFSEAPDGVTTFPIVREGFSYQEDFATPANTIIVRGKTAETVQETTRLAVTSDADDAYITGTNTAFVPVPVTAVDSGVLIVENSRISTGPNTFRMASAFLRFDTSGIPDDATIISAKLKLYVISKADGGESLRVQIYYYPSSNWPIDSTDQLAWFTPPAVGALAPAPFIASGIPASGPVQFDLTNLASIEKSGYTGFMLHLVQVTPTAVNNVQFRGRSAVGETSELEITYERGVAAVSGGHTDAASVARYGVRTKMIVDRSIETIADANLRAEFEAAQYANPVRSFTMQWDQDGILIGRAVPVTLQKYALDGQYVVKKLTMKWLTDSDTVYSAELGSLRPDLARLIRRLALQGR